MRALIADDYVDAADSIAMLLENAGLETQVANDGDEAFARASHWHPDVCVFDVDMPGLEGNEIARRIRQQCWSERPLLIAMSGWFVTRGQQSALEAGFDHWVGKPFEPAQLIRLIQDYLAARPRGEVGKGDTRRMEDHVSEVHGMRTYGNDV